MREVRKKVENKGTSAANVAYCFTQRTQRERGCLPSGLRVPLRPIILERPLISPIAILPLNGPDSNRRRHLSLIAFLSVTPQKII